MTASFTLQVLVSSHIAVIKSRLRLLVYDMSVGLFAHVLILKSRLDTCNYGWFGCWLFSTCHNRVCTLISTLCVYAWAVLY